MCDVNVKVCSRIEKYYLTFQAVWDENREGKTKWEGLVLIKENRVYQVDIFVPKADRSKLSSTP